MLGTKPISLRAGRLGAAAFAVAFALVLACPLSASAATVSVPVDAAALRAAITAAADGDTLQLGSGEYLMTGGLVVINKHLTIIGAGRSATVIKSGTNTTTASVTYPATTGFIQVNSPGSLTISNMTLDGGSAEGIRTGAIVYAQAPLTVDNVTVRNAKFDKYVGIGLVLIGQGPHTVTNASFEEIERIGVYAGAHPDYLATAPILPASVVYSATIDGCSFVGAGAGDFCQYGIEVGRSGRALVQGSEFSAYSGVASDGSASAGILADSYYGGGVAKLVLTTSRFFDSAYGIEVAYFEQVRDTWVDISATEFDNVANDLTVEGSTAIQSVPHGSGNYVTDGDWVYAWYRTPTDEITPAPDLCKGFFNRAPVGIPDFYAVPFGVTLSTPLGAVVSNDVDADEDLLLAELVTGPTKGTLQLHTDGSFTYTPNPGATGSDSFTYKAKDRFTESAATQVTLSIAPGPQLTPIYRFYSPRSGTHFYTPSGDEKDDVIRKWPDVWQYEGIAYWVDPGKNTQALYRFYNRTNGSHFYTSSADEANTVMTKYAAVFQYDGQTYAVTPQADAGKAPVYRFFNLRNGSHFYTASEDEKNHVIATWPDVYRLEGPAFWLGQ